MNIENAITKLFEFGEFVEYYGADKARIIQNKLLTELPLDKSKDQQLPEWAVKILECSTIGYKQRIRLILLHHYDIVGKPGEYHLVRNKTQRPSWKAHLDRQKDLEKKKEQEEK